MSLQEAGTQRWYAVWSLVLWAVGLAFFVANMPLPESAPDEAFGIVFPGVILSIPVGLVLAVLALRTKSEKHKGKATTGVVLNSITLVAYILVLIIGATLSAE